MNREFYLLLILAAVVGFWCGFAVTLLVGSGVV